MSTLPYPFPQSEFIPWSPPADGATFTVPAPANSLTSYPSLRVQNTTRGTLYISNNIGSTPGESVFDYRIGPYSSETITPNAQGVEVLWRGVAGSGETVGFTWSALASAPGGASVGEPYFPRQETVAWFPNDLTNTFVYVGKFLSPAGGLAAWQIAPPEGNDGETIVALQVENRTTYSLGVYGGGIGGPQLAEVEPMRATTLQVGYNAVYVTTDGPNTNRSGGDQFVQFYAYNSIPKLDPAAMYELPGIHEPGGTMLQRSYANVIGGGGAAGVLTIDAGKTFVLHSATIEMVGQVGAAVTTDTGALRVTQGLDGQGVAVDILSVGVLGGAASVQSSAASLQGPMMIPSRKFPFAPNSIDVVRTLGLVPAFFNVSLFGWYLPDTQ